MFPHHSNTKNKKQTVASRTIYLFTLFTYNLLNIGKKIVQALGTQRIWEPSFTFFMLSNVQPVLTSQFNMFNDKNEIKYKQDEEITN